jgi:S-DNA-T family DNA segregation ATPase FtsK/SpoIIIE
LLYKASPVEVKLIMVDPKRVELSAYEGIPHLSVPVVTEAEKAAAVLRAVVAEMEKRYKLFAERGVRDLPRFNQTLKKDEAPLPYVVVFIDELADLMAVAPVEVEDAICRLAQMARATGIHLVVATQRPSVDVITGLIKANIPSRIAFAVSSQVDSRTILDCTGAEHLLGRGDMLYSPVGALKPQRVQGALVLDEEIKKVTEFRLCRGLPQGGEDRARREGPGRGRGRTLLGSGQARGGAGTGLGLHPPAAFPHRLYQSRTAGGYDGGTGVCQSP